MMGLRFFDFVMLILATFAVSVVMSQEHGPFAVFSRWRSWLEEGLPSPPVVPDSSAPAEVWLNYEAYYPEWERARYGGWWGTVAGAFGCVVCLGAYVSLLLVVMCGGLNRDAVMNWLAVYGGHLVLVKLSHSR